MGIGTKTLPTSIYMEDRISHGFNTASRLVKDCHAEVLARRGYINHNFSYYFL